MKKHPIAEVIIEKLSRRCLELWKEYYITKKSRKSLVMARWEELHRMKLSLESLISN